VPAYLLRRFAASLLLLYLVLTLTFVLLRLVPGDPLANLSEIPVPQHQKDLLIHSYGLDRPLVEQYVRWLAAVTLHGDWGISYGQQRPAADVVIEALPATLLLAVAALFVEFSVGLTLGVVAARHHGTRLDGAIRLVTQVMYSQPTFWVALLAVIIFSYYLRWLPASHMQSVGADQLGGAGRLVDLLRHLTLPALTLGLIEAAATARYVRASLLDVLACDYVRTARAAGLSERRVLWVHALRATLVPLIQRLGVSVPELLSGILIIEVVFAWPGIGRVTYDATSSRDYPVIIATTAVAAALAIGGNLVADLLHAAVDPRLRKAERA
jgi:peptide/nickel transport system permease protein